MKPKVIKDLFVENIIIHSTESGFSYIDDKDLNKLALEVSKRCVEDVKFHLDQFVKLLLEQGYCDSDVYDEPPTAIDQYIELMKIGV